MANVVSEIYFLVYHCSCAFFSYRDKRIYGSKSYGIKKLIESEVWSVWLPKN